MISALSPLDLDEVLRYMGCPAEKADPETRALVETCAREMEAAARPRWTGRVLDITLEEDGVVRFPDAPTLRGVKHLDELAKAREAGYEAAVCFVIQMENVRWFAPNDETHPEFGQALRRAAQAGVEILAMDCAVTPQSLTMGKSVPIRL